MNVIPGLLKKHGIVITGLVILLSRLPFLSAGYGSEEDANGMALTARNIAQSGVYEYSRLPGHPVPELVYSSIYPSGAWGFNLLTAVISTLGIIFFMLALKRAGITSYLAAGVALAFTPVVYIASTNAMDYTWAMAFTMIAFYLILDKKWWLAGLAMGLAIGCRITSAAMILPFLILIWNRGEQKAFYMNAIRFSFSTVTFSLLVFLPVINRYGFAFFDFYETVYPSFAKAFYKFTFAVYGTVGLLALAFIKSGILVKIRKNKLTGLSDDMKILMITGLAVIFIYTALYWFLPQKAAFMIPAVPFIILLAVLLADKKSMLMLTVCLFISCFFFGINLSDPDRGGKLSALAVPFAVGSQQAAFDPLVGTVWDDHLKRKQRLAYSRNIISVTDTIHEKMAVIAGWWLGDILVQQKASPKGQTEFLYYASEDTLSLLKQQGYHIYFLPQQDVYNDQHHHHDFTARYSAPWPY